MKLTYSSTANSMVGMQENSNEDRSLSSLYKQRVTKAGPCPPGANILVAENNIKQENTKTLILESDGNSENIHGQRKGHGTEIWREKKDLTRDTVL